MELLTLIKKSLDKVGIDRIYYEDRNVPNHLDLIRIFPLFYNLESLSVFSSLYKSYLNKEEYNVILTLPFMKGIIPSNEFWSHKDSKSLIEEVQWFSNDSKSFTMLIRHLNQHYMNVVTNFDLDKLFKDYKINQKVIVNFPEINSITYLKDKSLQNEFSSKEKKIFVYPVKTLEHVKNGIVERLEIDKLFWVNFISLLKEKYRVITWVNEFSYDVSKEFNSEIAYCHKMDISEVLTTMNLCDYVIDCYLSLGYFPELARANCIRLMDKNIIEKKNYLFWKKLFQSNIKDIILSPVNLTEISKDFISNNVVDYLINQLPEKANLKYEKEYEFDLEVQSLVYKNLLTFIKN